MKLTNQQKEKLKGAKILITGGAGFIGSNLVKKIYKDYELILVDDLSEGSALNLPRALRKKLIRKRKNTTIASMTAIA